MSCFSSSVSQWSRGWVGRPQPPLGHRLWPPCSPGTSRRPQSTTTDEGNDAGRSGRSGSPGSLGSLRQTRAHPPPPRRQGAAASGGPKGHPTRRRDPRVRGSGRSATPVSAASLRDRATPTPAPRGLATLRVHCHGSLRCASALSFQDQGIKRSRVKGSAVYLETRKPPLSLR